MNMKNTAILLIFLLSVLGLIVGVCYTDDTASINSSESVSEAITEYDNGTIIISLENEQNNGLIKFFT